MSTIHGTIGGAKPCGFQSRLKGTCGYSTLLLTVSNGFNILKDNWGRWKQHSRTMRESFMAPRKPRVLTLGQS
ncbi:hypothetical protein TNCV_5048121 [Trichonephila clavipes]|nr:hypothetical protein TNCV_5048121 [Trichonephila clavipes]